MNANRQSRPVGITVIAIVNGVAAALHLAFWGLAFIKLPAPWVLAEPPARAAAAFTFGFGVADMLWSVPLLILGALGLVLLRSWGWLCALAANVLYGYSLTVIGVRDLATGWHRPDQFNRYHKSLS